ncbi:hypothetical protein A2872_04140 [Candidatus Gottesmanbacteria bacterium RIFCSPHIGHO2_01_FULL_42_12]|uniref:Response regulatory domain-containing protein n=1 Tax=Candidatus Gottesmanbacteria bacterium RIFCSPHIGHO2_01_FULL_42_12 TaxID=1798377 RepID=A0A1F5Z1A7_9BACT|nr:MAG: hypothetical protein A2872_04140 [Candidatus Gottesmanbacteria bacterium RIFCSPHIGHO2_01_FULL_42_12]
MADMKKILVFEDDKAMAKLYQVELTTKGFMVETAGDGVEGTEKAESFLPDLILLDIMMPKQNGIDTLKKLRENPKFKDIPVLMLTNFGQESLVKEAFSAGATDYIFKYQSTPAEVTEKVKQYLFPTNTQLPEV